MSGSITEALLGNSGGMGSNTAKKVPLLPPPPKQKKEPKTFCFKLVLPESNEQTYPEFSWAELVRNAKQKELSKKAGRGTTILDPYASDDEEDLKAMAAKFEAKYNNSSVPPKKKKRRAEDLLDRGAGYDETDPFIDNSDIYDEVVPVDLQTKHGGFYINSGSLDFKELELSEEEEDSVSQPPKTDKFIKPKDKVSTLVNKSLDKPQEKVKNPVGRPPGAINKAQIPGDKMKMPKKRKLIISPVGPDGKIIHSKSALNLNETHQPTGEKPRPIQDLIQTPKSGSKPIQYSSSSSSSSTTSSSDDSSSSSESESDTTEDKEKSKETKSFPLNKPKTLKPSPKPIHVSAKSIGIANTMRPPPVDNNLSFTGSASTPTPPKRLKTKNVPLNPKLHPNLAALSTTPPSIPSSNNVQLKSFNKDLLNKSTNGNNTSTRVQSPLIAAVVPPFTPSPPLKVATPKNITPTSNSTGLTISPVITSGMKLANAAGANMSVKLKTNQKQVTNPPQITHIGQMDIFQNLGNYPNLATLATLPFPTPITPTSSLLKGGMSMPPQKTLPNLKKLGQHGEKVDKLPQPHSQQRMDKLSQPQSQQRQQKIKIVKKPKPPTPNNTAPPPLPPTSPLNSGGVQHSFLSAFKGPPPLAGPGVEMSKSRTPIPYIAPSGGNVNKSISNARTMAATNTNLLPVSLASTTANQLSTSFSSMLNSTTSSLVNSIPSSLTVQRLTQSVTISPTANANTPYLGSDRGVVGSGSSNRSTLQQQSSQYSVVGATDIRPVKHSSPFDVSSLLQKNSSGGMTYSGTSVITMGSSSSGGTKSGAGKLANNVDRDMTSRKQ